MAIFVASVHDSLQALNRIVSLLRGRQFSIDAMTLARTEQPAVARLTLVVNEAQPKPQRVATCLDKLEEVVSIREAMVTEVVCRDAALIKLRESAAVTAWLAAYAANGLARVAERADASVIVEIFGTTQDVDRAMAALPAGAVVESSRLGPLVLPR